MACHPTHNGKGRALHPNFSDLEETGRLHFFYHSPSSQLPVRDVLDEQKHGYKTEPYIEKCAENYCLECYQDNIRGFLQSGERYLFLFTTCRYKRSKHVGQVYVVGYIKKRRCELRPGGFYAAIGPVKLVSFNHAWSLGDSRHDNNPRQMQKKLTLRKTQQILDHFEGKENILNRCRMAIKELQRQLPFEERRNQAELCK